MIVNHPLPPHGTSQKARVRHSIRNSNSHQPKEIGICLPEPILIKTPRTPQYFRGMNQNSTQQVEERSSSSVTFLRIGDEVAPGFQHKGVSKIPDLPVKTRLPRTMKTQSYDMYDEPVYTTKYLGENGDVIGCFTSKTPLKQLARRPNTSFIPNRREVPPPPPSSNILTPRREYEKKQRRIRAFFAYK